MSAKEPFREGGFLAPSTMIAVESRIDYARIVRMCVGSVLLLDVVEARVVVGEMPGSSVSALGGCQTFCTSRIWRLGTRDDSKTTQKITDKTQICSHCFFPRLLLVIVIWTAAYKGYIITRTPRSNCWANAGLLSKPETYLAKLDGEVRRGGWLV